MSKLCTFLERGEAMDYTPLADVSVGDVVVLDERIGIAATDIAAGELGAVNVVGVFTMPAPNDEAFAQGQRLFWDASGEVVSTRGATATVTADEDNTAGVGAMGTVTPLAIDQSETFTVTCTAKVADYGTFSVTGSIRGALPNLTGGVLYNNGLFSCTLAVTSTDFEVGDEFVIDIVVTPKAGYAFAAKAETATEVPVKIG